MEKTEDKIQPIELTQNWHIVPVAEDFETVTIIIFHMFKKLWRDMWDIKKKGQVELLEVKTIVSEMKNSGDRFRVKLHIVEERVNQHEGMRVETLQNKSTQRKN